MKVMLSLCVAVLVLVGCQQQPDMETAELVRYYAQRGDQIANTSQKVPQHNPKPGVTEHLSTTNSPPAYSR